MTYRNERPLRSIRAQAMEVKLRLAGLDIGEILEAAEADDGSGFCVSCGAMAYSCEPDAERYTCDCCGAQQVYGASFIIEMVAI